MQNTTARNTYEILVSFPADLFLMLLPRLLVSMQES